jgi:hypothetical protein
MKTVLEKVEGLDDLIRQLRKMESRLRAGHFIDCNRDVCRMIAALEKEKRDVISSQGSNGDGE